MLTMADETFNAEEGVRAAPRCSTTRLRASRRGHRRRRAPYPATLPNWHSGAEPILSAAVAGLVLTEMAAETPDPVSMAWDEWLTESARAYRRVMKQHPDLAAWAVTHLEASVPVPEFLERIGFLPYSRARAFAMPSKSFGSALQHLCVGSLWMGRHGDDP